MTEARDLQILTDPIGTYACAGCGVKLDLSGRPAFSPVRCPSCRTEMQVPARVGSFILVELLGSGGMGSAYRARDESLNRDVAIKVMRKSFGDDPKFVETFRREAQTAAKLNHPNVVQIHSFGEFKGQPYIVMELVTGGSLDRLIATGEPLDQTMVMRIGMEIASALQSGYQMQLVHGDIKPENILLDEKGASKLVDFGIAQLAGGGGANGESREVWGTPYYVAPEKVRRQRTDCRADIYSLGGTLFHALVGKPPFDGPDATAVVKERFLKPAPPLREMRPDIDPEIESIVARMLQVEPSMRYPTYESLLSDMRRFLDRAGPSSVAAKRVVFLRKKGTGPAGAAAAVAKMATDPLIPATPGSASGAGASKPSGKLIIRTGGGGGRSTTGLQTSGSSYSPTGSHAAASVPPKTGMPATVVVLLVLLGILFVGGLAVGIVLLSRHAGGKAAPPANPNTSQAAQAAAMRRVNDCLLQSQAAVSNLIADAAIGEKLCGAANQAVVDVLGAEQHDIMIPLRPPTPVTPMPPAAIAGTNASGTNAVAPAPPLVDPVREESLKEPVLLQVRNIYRAWYRMDDLAVEATTLFDEMTTAAAAAATTPPEKLNLQADVFADRIQSFANGTKADESRRKLANIRNDLATVSNMVQVIRKRLEKEADLAKKQAADAAEIKRRAEEESRRQEKIKGEIAGIAAKEDEVRDLLHKHAYSDARRQLRTVFSGLTEEESRKAYAAATQRVARLEELQGFLMIHVPGYQHPTEGWKIESADKSGLIVRNKNGTNVVSWADVGDVRTVLFLRHFLMDEESSRDLKLREHVRELINAALYCRRFVPESKSVQGLADKMLEKAVSMLPDAKEEIELLLPNAGLKADPDKPADKPAGEAATK